MDPSGPLFATNSNRSVGLYIDCANFVDIISTSDTFGSTPEPSEQSLVLGHQNYFPNNGTDQSGCSMTSAAIEWHGIFFLDSFDKDCLVARENCSETNDLPVSIQLGGRSIYLDSILQNHY